MYRAGKRPKSKKRRAIKWLVLLAVLIGLGFWGAKAIGHALKPKTVITQSRAVVTHVSYTPQLKQYNEGDFTISLPTTWSPLPRPAGPYKSFTWQSADRITDGQVIVIYEDIIPSAFSVNRELIVQGEGDHVSTDGSISDNCTNYTSDLTPTTNPTEEPARWQGVSFLCDAGNTERDVIGTSSTDGINTVILTSPSTKMAHKFLFTYTDFSTNPDYTVFTNALSSFLMN